jgi:ParB family transcriptional regulator, chromosome partitioning protein
MMMMKRPSGLGRGLGALIPPSSGGTYSSGRQESVSASPQTHVESGSNHSVYQELPVDSIVANPHQPRQHFDHAALEDLVSSIAERGVIEPLIVTNLGNGTYELIAGERRLRASIIAGLNTVPCVIRTATEQEKLELAIIENVQRHDLNPIEEAVGYRRLMDEFGLTQDEVGEKVGKSRPQVANIVRLLQLPEEIRQALIERKINASNARTLLSLPTDDERMKLFQAMLSQNFTVRETEKHVSHPRAKSGSSADPNILEFERRLRESTGQRVNIKCSAKGEGEIRIPFQSEEDLAGLMQKLVREN